MLNDFHCKRIGKLDEDWVDMDSHLVDLLKILLLAFEN